MTIDEAGNFRNEYFRILQECLTGQITKDMALRSMRVEHNKYECLTDEDLKQMICRKYNKNSTPDSTSTLSYWIALATYEEPCLYKKTITEIESLPETAPQETPDAPVIPQSIPKIIEKMQNDSVVGRDPIGGKYPVIIAQAKPFAAIFNWAGKDNAMKLSNTIVQNYLCFSDGKPFNNSKSINNARNAFFKKN